MLFSRIYVVFCYVVVAWVYFVYRQNKEEFRRIISSISTPELLFLCGCAPLTLPVIVVYVLYIVLADEDIEEG